MFSTKILFGAVVLTFSGCATNVWNKPGGSTDEFASARYECLQEAQQQTGSAVFGKLSGVAVNGMATNDGLFSACMNSKGWTLTAKAPAGSAPAINPLAESGKTLNAENAEMCARPDMQAIMAKSACAADLITLPQLADATYLISMDKEQFSIWRTEVAARNVSSMKALRQYGGDKGALIAKASDAAFTQLDRHSLSLYTGKITWGEYNQARKTISQARNVEVAKIGAQR